MSNRSFTAYFSYIWCCLFVKLVRTWLSLKEKISGETPKGQNFYRHHVNLESQVFTALVLVGPEGPGHWRELGKARVFPPFQSPCRIWRCSDERWQ